MGEQFSRSDMLLGASASDILRGCRVAVFGIGGVGSYTAEALARSGVGTLDLIDDDKVCLSNINRHLYATHKTVGLYKVDVAADRARDIFPDIKINKHRCFFLPKSSSDFTFEQFDYVVDAVDTMSAKLEIVRLAKEAKVPVISSMSAGNKLDPTEFKVSDIYKTSVCPLSKIMRRELRRLGIDSLKVVYSEEPAVKPLADAQDNDTSQQNRAPRRAVPGSVAFVPPVVGLIMAGEVIKDLLAARAKDEKGDREEGQDG